MKNLDNKTTNIIAGQMLCITEACAITGLSKSCITSKIHSGTLYAALVARRFMIPGIILLEYMKSPDYSAKDIKELLEMMDAIWCAQKCILSEEP